MFTLNILFLLYFFNTFFKKSLALNSHRSCELTWNPVSFPHWKEVVHQLKLNWILPFNWHRSCELIWNPVSSPHQKEVVHQLKWNWILAFNRHRSCELTWKPVSSPHWKEVVHRPKWNQILPSFLRWIHLLSNLCWRHSSMTKRFWRSSWGLHVLA